MAYNNYIYLSSAPPARSVSSPYPRPEILEISSAADIQIKQLDNCIKVLSRINNPVLMNKLSLQNFSKQCTTIQQVASSCMRN